MSAKPFYQLNYQTSQIREHSRVLEQQPSNSRQVIFEGTRTDKSKFEARTFEDDQQFENILGYNSRVLEQTLPVWVPSNLTFLSVRVPSNLTCLFEYPRIWLICLSTLECSLSVRVPSNVFSSLTCLFEYPRIWLVCSSTLESVRVPSNVLEFDLSVVSVRVPSNLNVRGYSNRTFEVLENMDPVDNM